MPLTVFLESAEVKFVIADRLFTKFVLVGSKIFLDALPIAGSSTCCLVSAEINAASIASAVFKSHVH